MEPRRRRGDLPGPSESVPGVQHERTALAWERTAISLMVAGVALARYAAEGAHFVIGSVGIVQTLSGGLLLLWASRHASQLSDPLQPASAVPQVWLTRIVGLVSVAFIGFSLLLALIVALS